MKVSQATLAQIKSQFEGDMHKIRSKLPTKDAQTVETAKDMKYIRDRQKIFAFNFDLFLEDCPYFNSVGEGSGHVAACSGKLPNPKLLDY